MAVVFVNRFYRPDEPATGQLLTDLAEALAARGFEVRVVTSHPGSDHVPRSETCHGVHITRLRSARGRTVGPFRKALDFGTFFLAALWHVARSLRRGDVVVAMTDPPLLGVGVSVVASLRQVPVIHWIQDIYPEVAIQLAGQRWLKLLRPLRDRTWRNAAACVTLGRDMAGLVTRAGVPASRLHRIPNWPPTGLAEASASALAAQRQAWGLAGKFVVAYSGNLGRVHDLDPVIAAAVLLRDEPQVVFVFIGGGAQRPALEQQVAAHRLANVLFFPAQPRAALGVTLGVGDVHLVTLLPGCEQLVYPSKLYGIAAVGRPVVFVGPPVCELAEVVRHHDLGRAVSRDDVPALAATLRELAADPAARARHAVAARRFAASHDLASAVSLWHEVLTPHAAPP